MDDWLKSFGPGEFTCGAKYICFLPEGGKDADYRKLARCLPDMEDSPEWLLFAERVTDYLNELRELIAEHTADKGTAND